MRLASSSLDSHVYAHDDVSPERLLDTTKYQGFPVVKSRKDLTLLGDISRRDLIIAIGARAPNPLPEH